MQEPSLTQRKQHMEETCPSAPAYGN